MYLEKVFSFQIFFTLAVLPFNPLSTGFVAIGVEKRAFVLTGQHDDPPCLMQVL